MLTDSGSSDELQNRHVEIVQNLTDASIISIVCNSVPLNDKQHLVVEKIISKMLECAGNPYDSSSRNQTMLYVRGEGGVGKARSLTQLSQRWT